MGKVDFSTDNQQAQKKPKINFNPEIFNNIFWHLKSAFEDESIRYIWCYGGSSAAKTFTVCQLTLLNMLSSGEYNTMVMRKISEDIKDSIYSDFKRIIENWDLGHLFICQQNFIKCKTGAYIRFRGLDDSEKVKGIANFKKLILEEISQFEEEDFKQIRKRLRGQKGQQIVGIFNPIIEEHWIKKNVFDIDNWVEETTDPKIAGKWRNTKGNSMILKTNYLDNKWIVGPEFKDQHVIDDYEWDKIHDYAKYEVYALGNWGRLITGGEFYKNFKPEIHVKQVAYNPNLPLHLSWDENVNPYLPCGVFQIQGKTIMFIDLFLGINPNNKVSAVCNMIKNKYGTHTSGMFIYGDATSQKDDVKQEKGYDLFKLIMDNLAFFKPVKRVPQSNPSVVMRGNFINAVFEYNEGGIYFFISEKLPEVLREFSMVKEASDGGKDKKVVKNKTTGVSYQEYGHISDLTDYIICKAFESEFSKFQRGGKGFQKPIYQKKGKVY